LYSIRYDKQNVKVYINNFHIYHGGVPVLGSLTGRFFVFAFNSDSSVSNSICKW